MKTMRNTGLFLIFTIMFGLGFAQTDDQVFKTDVQDTENIMEFPRHEVNYNIANTLAIASVELGYEYFFQENQSVGIKFLINDRFNYRSEGKGRKFDSHSVQLNYSYYFGVFNPGSEFFVRPLVKYRFGDFKEDGEKLDMNSFLIGIGGGYVWNFSNNFIISPFANVGRNFSSKVKDRFSAIEFNAGLNIGYRF